MGWLFLMYLSLTLPLPAKASFYKLKCFDVMLCFCVLLQASSNCLFMFSRFSFAKNTHWRRMKPLCWSFCLQAAWVTGVASPPSAVMPVCFQKGLHIQ